MNVRAQPFFHERHPGDLGQRFCIWTAAGQTPKALVVHAHAFAEEMNKSRRMVALQARALASNCTAVLQMDLLGCGDSAGDAADARWDAWSDDLVAACALARSRFHAHWPHAPEPPLVLWGLRAGCLLAAQVASRAGAKHLLLWAPVLQGRSHLQQFLRIASLGSALGKTPAAASPKEALARGDTAQVAGYAIHPGLASGLEQARLEPPSVAGHLAWLDVQPGAATAPSPATSSALAAWEAAGWTSARQSVSGPMFWQTQEIEESPALIKATCTAVGAWFSTATQTA